MILIPQHGEKGQLNDMNSFVPLIESLVMPKKWKVSVEWCIGEGSDAIENSRNDPWHGSHESFRNYYREIYQTVDGQFTVQSDEGSIKFEAVDSSYWQIESDIPGIEEAFMNQYGLYKGYFPE